MQKIELNKLKFEVEINASIEKVWEKMLGDEGYRVWTAEFNPGGSWYKKEHEGEFVTGENVDFLGPDQNGNLGGMISKVYEVKKPEFISFQHLGYNMNGVRDTTSEAMQALFPSFENYTFEKLDDNKTKVHVDMDSDPKYTEMFNGMWPKALNKLKEICEQ
jgi:uncharacterized protein YndB with AHSA1/START domain